MMRTRAKRFACLAMLPLVSGCSLILGDGRGVRAGLTYSWSNFSRFQGMVGDQEGIASAFSDETINQLGLSGEVTAGPWFYGSEIRFGQHDWTQTFLPGGGRPNRGYGKVRGNFLDLSGGRRWRLHPRVSTGLWTGPTLTYNVGEGTWEYGDESVEEERSLTNLKWNVGGYVDLEPVQDWSLRASYGHLSFRSDADDHNFFKISVLRTLTSGTREFYRPGKFPGAAYEKAIVARLDSMRSSARRPQP